MRENRLSRFRFLILVVAMAGVLAAAGCSSNRVPTPTTPAITAAPVVTPTTTTSPTSTPKPTPYNINIASKTIIGSYLVDGRV